MMRPMLLAVIGLVLAGCAPKSPMTIRIEHLSGAWKGLNQENPKSPNEGASSNILTESLGGYKLVLNSNGSFTSDWRGLRRSGTWAVVGDTIELKIDRVLDKTRPEAEKENGAAGNAVNDLSLYEKQNKLELSSNDTTMTLKATQKGSDTVVFIRDSGQ